MSSPTGSLRQRAGKKAVNVGAFDENDILDPAAAPASSKAKASSRVVNVKQSDRTHRIWLAIVTVLAFVTRFKGITYPDSVVFDEVHFGKFASYYLQRTYFFDVHPPFAKLLFAFVGWLVGYDGHFLFDNIGDSYIENKLRSAP
ncbi:Dolichyl-phosphate-mannose--protein mannosyltransferase 4 [Ascosphaera atra]|nr:Dolichyl-phosphate-mannose--protein mannosyltransferase 4 [Ascosphaera atra]